MCATEGDAREGDGREGRVRTACLGLLHGDFGGCAGLGGHGRRRRPGALSEGVHMRPRDALWRTAHCHETSPGGAVGKIISEARDGLKIAIKPPTS